MKDGYHRTPWPHDSPGANAGNDLYLIRRIRSNGVVKSLATREKSVGEMNAAARLHRVEVICTSSMVGGVGLGWVGWFSRSDWAGTVLGNLLRLSQYEHLDQANAKTNWCKILDVCLVRRINNPSARWLG